MKLAVVFGFVAVLTLTAPASAQIEPFSSGNVVKIGVLTLAGLLLFISDVHRLGLQTAHGLQLTSAFYWDQDDATWAWSKRFFDKTRSEPTMVQAGVYGAIMHYLAAIKATGTTDGGLHAPGPQRILHVEIAQ
jgi:Periplasmic binding protein